MIPTRSRLKVLLKRACSASQPPIFSGHLIVHIIVASSLSLYGTSRPKRDIHLTNALFIGYIRPGNEWHGTWCMPSFLQHPSRVRPSVRPSAPAAITSFNASQNAVFLRRLSSASGIRSSLERGDTDNHCLSRNIGGLDPIYVDMP